MMFTQVMFQHLQKPASNLCIQATGPFAHNQAQTDGSPIPGLFLDQPRLQSRILPSQVRLVRNLCPHLSRLDVWITGGSISDPA